jgi:hypothetical protein
MLGQGVCGEREMWGERGREGQREMWGERGRERETLRACNSWFVRARASISVECHSSPNFLPPPRGKSNVDARDRGSMYAPLTGLHAATQFYGESLSKTLASRIVGGIIAALLYFTLVVLTSNVGESLGGKGTTGFLVVLPSLTAASLAASYVGDTCLYVCIAASIVITIYLQSASSYIHGRR